MRYVEEFAGWLWERRYWLLGVTAISFIAFLPLPPFVLILSAGKVPVTFTSGVLMALICISWGLFCGAVWFRPARGVLRQRPNWAFPFRFGLAVIRVWFAVMLAIILVVGSLGALVIAAHSLEAQQGIQADPHASRAVGLI